MRNQCLTNLSNRSPFIEVMRSLSVKDYKVTKCNLIMPQSDTMKIIGSPDIFLIIFDIFQAPHVNNFLTRYLDVFHFGIFMTLSQIFLVPDKPSPTIAYSTLGHSRGVPQKLVMKE